MILFDKELILLKPNGEINRIFNMKYAQRIEATKTMVENKTDYQIFFEGGERVTITEEQLKDLAGITE